MEKITIKDILLHVFVDGMDREKRYPAGTMLPAVDFEGYEKQIREIISEEATNED